MAGETWRMRMKRMMKMMMRIRRGGMDGMTAGGTGMIRWCFAVQRK
jgi:hypothetical protein